MARARKNESEVGAVEVPAGWADILFDKALELRDDYEAVVAARKANRESLRNLATQGLLAEAEIEALSELYPERQRHNNNEVNRESEGSE